MIRCLFVCWTVLAALPGHAEEPSLQSTNVESIRHRIRRVATTLNDKSLLQELQAAPMVVWADQAFLGMDDVYTGRGSRYLTVRVSIGNGTDRDLVLPRTGIALLAGDRRISIGSAAQDYPLQVDRGLLPPSRLKTPEKISLPAGAGASFWCLFSGLPLEQDLSKLVLNCQFDAETQIQLDLNAQMEARLGLADQLVGPRGAVAVLTIHGHLNTLNARVLARRMSVLHDQGCERMVVEWSPRAVASEELLLDWLLSASTPGDRDEPLHMQLPHLPPVRNFRLSKLPRDNRDQYPSHGQRPDRASGVPASLRQVHDSSDGIFEQTQDAVANLLGEIYQQLDSQQILTELRSGHRWSRLAALQRGGNRLGPEALPLLFGFLESDDRELKRSAIVALGAQNDPRARERIAAIFESGQSAEIEAALRGLLQSGQESSRQFARTMLQQRQIKMPAERIVWLLGHYYHPDWDGELLKFATGQDVPARCAALNSLQGLGHPELPQLCIQALADANVSVRETAFQVLISRPEPECEKAALEHVLARLREGRFDSADLAFIERTRENRAAPLLLAQLDSAGDRIDQLIQVLGVIGSSEHLQVLTERILELTAEQQVTVLQLCDRLPATAQVRAAQTTLHSPDPGVFHAAVEVLTNVCNEQAVTLLGDQLEKARQDRLQMLCVALGKMGTEESIGRLRALRDVAVRNRQNDRLRAIQSGMEAWQMQLPGWNYVESGLYYAQEEDFKTAEKWYGLAIEINPELGPAFSSRANILLRQEKYQQAGKDFQKAYELDPYDSQAVTGVAIIQAIEGDWEAALEFVKSRSHYHPENDTFEYNVACVYGRAVEYLERLPASDERNQNLQRLQSGGISHLQQAVRLGFDEFGWMMLDPDLASLRDLPEFRALIPLSETEEEHDPDTPLPTTPE